MEQMHNLLKRQLRRCFGDQVSIPEEWQAFIEAVNAAYRESDADRGMLERSLELSSQELLQANSELWAIFQAMPDLLFRLDREGVILTYEAGSSTHFFLRPEELIGKRIQDIPLKGVRGKFREAIRQVQETRTIVSIEYSLAIQDQELFYETRLLPLREDQIIVIVRNITDRKQAEEQRKAHVHFLESLEQVNRAIHQADDIEQMLWDAMKTVYSILDCDRVWLLYPCDPEAPTFRVPVEVSRPGYPGAFVLNRDIPMKPGADQVCVAALASEGPVPYGPETEHSIYKELTEQFGVLSQMVMAVYPKVGKPWMFGLHQCSHARVWTQDEQRLFKEIGRRIGDTLSTLLTFRDLRESEERFNLAVQGSGDGLWDWPDIEKEEQWWSPRRYEMLGYEPGEIKPTVKSWLALIHPADRDEALAAMQEHFQTRRPYDVEYRMQHKSGEYLWIRSRGQSIWDEGGRIRRMSGSHQDVTVRKRAEEALKKSQKDLEARTKSLHAVNSIADTLHSSLDLQTVVDWAVDSIMEYLQISAVAIFVVEEETGSLNRLSYRGFGELDQEVIQVGEKLPLESSLSGHAVTRQELVVSSDVANDDRLVPQVRQALIAQGFKQIISVPLLFQEQALGAINLFFKERPTLAPHERETLLSIAKTIGLAMANARYVAQIEAEVTARKEAEEEIRQLNAELEQRVIKRTAQLETQALELAVAKERALEARRIAESNAQAAEAANRAKSAFLASMSHELRTPLNAVLGYAQILKQRQLAPEVIDNLNVIQRSGEHLLTLITDVLDIAKIEAGRMELHPTPLHFPNFLDNIAGIIGARAEAKGLAFNFDTPPIFPEGGIKGGVPTWVQADETRLRQVLLNLLDNAVKFTEAGQVTLRVAGRQQQSGQGSQGAEEQGGDFSPAPRPPGPPAHPPRLPSTAYCLRFEVKDTGIGISPDQLERIFQPFEQARAVLRHTEGTGLGLAISRELVRLMGGDLHVESPPFTSFLRSPLAATEGRTEGGLTSPPLEAPPGSLFWFEVALPATEAAAEVRSAQPSERVITGYRGSRRTVLVVDDVPSNRAVVVDLLQPLGFEVIAAADGQQAIHLAGELQPDLILIDRWMPVMDGFEAAQQMRQKPELTGAPIIAISASVSKEDQAQSREVGIDAFLPKPINWPNLAALLEEHLGLEWTYGQEQRGEGAGEQGEAFPSVPLVPPPEEEMAVLYDLALSGDMRGVQEWAAYTKTLGEQYIPFAKKLHELARGFEEGQILALVEQFMEENQ